MDEKYPWTLIGIQWKKDKQKTYYMEINENVSFDVIEINAS